MKYDETAAAMIAQLKSDQKTASGSECSGPQKYKSPHRKCIRINLTQSQNPDYPARQSLRIHRYNR